MYLLEGSANTNLIYRNISCTSVYLIQDNYLGKFSYDELRSAVNAAWEQISVEFLSDFGGFNARFGAKQLFELTVCVRCTSCYKHVIQLVPLGTLPKISMIVAFGEVVRLGRFVLATSTATHTGSTSVNRPFPVAQNAIRNRRLERAPGCLQSTGLDPHPTRPRRYHPVRVSHPSGHYPLHLFRLLRRPPLPPAPFLVHSSLLHNTSPLPKCSRWLCRRHLYP